MISVAIWNSKIVSKFYSRNFWTIFETIFDLQVATLDIMKSERTIQFFFSGQ